MKNKWLLILLIIIVCACNKEKEDDTSFTIINKSDNDIEFATISTIYNRSKSADYRINKYNEVKFGYKLNENGDGALKLTYKFVNSKDTLKKDLGYYSNGHIEEKNWFIKIYNDSIKLDTELKKY